MKALTGQVAIIEKKLVCNRAFFYFLAGWGHFPAFPLRGIDRFRPATWLDECLNKKNSKKKLGKRIFRKRKKKTKLFN
jgi:hypothetical protein